jgi:hypothetical protein
VLEGPGLLLGEDDDLTGPLCESLEQVLCLSVSLFDFLAGVRRRTGCLILYFGCSVPTD